ncbi:MAG: glycosyltransferase family 9 protein [Nitrospinae bacterium]|nr:glycosyltransferase family 9 protein [Nitrospinota bacterium]
MDERFLIIRLGAIGDVVHTLPLAAAIKDARPDSHITWAVEPAPREVLLGNPDIDEILTVDTKAWRKNLLAGGFTALKRDLYAVKNVGADVALDAQGLFKSGLLAWASRAPVRIGFEHRFCREGMNVLFTTHHVLPPESPHHVVEKNLSLLGPLGLPVPLKEQFRFPLHETQREGEQAEKHLESVGHRDGRPLLVIHPGGGWVTKRWAPDRFAQLADHWQETDRGDVLLIWGPGEEKMMEEVADTMRTQPLAAPATSIREMMSLIRRGSCFVGGDSGPMHLAAAMGVRCLAIMGPTEPVRNGPWGAGNSVLHHRLACSGCYARKCPDIECLERVKVEEAIDALNLLQPAP